MVLPTAGAILDRAGSAANLMAAIVALGGFISHSRALLGGASEMGLHRATAIGGMCGLMVGLIVFVGDLVVS
jgi:hypothetical protein